MFYVVKHTPTDTWSPHLQNPVERSRYYSFLEGKAPQHGTPWTKEQLDFHKAFKYKNRELAETFIKSTSPKIKVEGKSAEDIAKDFVINEFEKWPINEMKLIDPGFKADQRRAHKVFVTKDITSGWVDMSKTYCWCCGILIPPKQKYLEVSGHINICAFCAIEALSEVKTSFDEFADKDLQTALHAERFIERI